MFFRKQVVTCVYPDSELFQSLFMILICILVVYIVLIALVLLVCYNNMVKIDRVRIGIDNANTKNSMIIRNIANERAQNDSRVVRVMGSIVDVLKQ